MYISQPALTAWINHLGQQYRVKLFNRNTKPARPTFAGERLIAMEQQIVNLENRLAEEMREIAQMKKGQLMFGLWRERMKLYHVFLRKIFHKARRSD